MNPDEQSRPPGRPSLPASDRKGRMLKIRLQDHQIEGLRSAAGKLKVSISEFIRELALSEAKIVNEEDEMLKPDYTTDEGNHHTFVVNHLSHKFLLYRCLEINRKFGIKPCLLFTIEEMRDREAYDTTLAFVEQWGLPIDVSFISDIKEL